MNILYHRISGAVGLTDHELGARGAWVEKRLNVLRWLQARRHEVTVYSRLTKASQADRPDDLRYAQGSGHALRPDLLVLEFGPSNGSWYKEDYEVTRELTRWYDGPVVYLCDDPDLLRQSVCRYVPQDDWSRWTFLLNCSHPEKAPELLGAPEEAAYAEFNPGVGLPQLHYAPSSIPWLCYPGRPGGRKTQCKIMEESEVVQIIGHASEWKSHGFVPGIVPSPEQAVRRQFYQQYTGLVCAFDDKHAQLGWRTGRAYHALSAGVPVLAFPGNPALWWTQEVKDVDDITTLWAVLTDDDDYRCKVVVAQRSQVLLDETDIIGFSTARALGL